MERTRAEDRRLASDRRLIQDRRVGDAPIELDARQLRDRRSGAERRLRIDSASGQVHVALGLLTRAAESGALGDDERRLLDSAMLRLRFALDAFE
jgi:hypothetical protein